MLKYSVCNWHTVVSTEVQQENTMWIQITQVFPPNHTVIVHVSWTIVSPSCVPSNILPRDSKKVEYKHDMAHEHKWQSGPVPGSRSKAHRSNSLIQWGWKTQSAGTKLDKYKSTYSCSPPLLPEVIFHTPKARSNQKPGSGSPGFPPRPLPDPQSIKLPESGGHHRNETFPHSKMKLYYQ